MRQETELRDAFARWEEARPARLDWGLRIDVVSARAAWRGMPEVGVPLAGWPSMGRKPGLHVAIVQLMVPAPLRGPGVPERVAAVEWRVGTHAIVQVIDVLAAAFEDEELMMHVELCMGLPWSVEWEHDVERWVWERLI